MNTDALNGVIGAIVGSLVTGAITFFVTSHFEKKQLKIENIEKRIAPYCALLEEIKKIEIDNVDKWFEKLNEPLLYSKPNKIIYLTKKFINLLDDYEKKLNDLKNTLQNEYNDIKSKYDEVIVNKVNPYFTGYNVKCSDLDYNDDFENKLKLSILNKNIDFQISHNLSNINFHHDYRGQDIPDNVNINHDLFFTEDEYEDEYNKDNYNEYDIVDIDGLHKSLRDIEKIKEIEFEKNLINKTKSNELKKDLSTQIDKMIKKSKAEISKATKVYRSEKWYIRLRDFIYSNK